MPILPKGNHCCGCSACFSACPHDSITMIQDFEGFYYPEVNPVTCTECKSCEVACPTLPYLDFAPYDQVRKKSRFPYDVKSHTLDSRGIFVHFDNNNTSFFDQSATKSNRLDPSSSIIDHPARLDSEESNSTPPPPYCFALKAKDASLREVSSSGGVFSLLALEVLKHDGVVFGACYDENLKVIHKPIHSPNELDQLRRSKYVESYIGESFKQVQTYLKAGKLVLFSGVQCQIQGLLSFLRKPYANLLTIEVVCNAVPSAKVWEIYKQSILKEEGEKLLDVNFRGKDYGWGYGFAIKTKTKTKTKPDGKVSFMQGFAYHFITRPSCENCYAKGFKSRADITIGDYWGVQAHHPEFYDTLGVTCALVHSRQGIEFMNIIAESMEIVPSTFEKILMKNPCLVRSYPCFKHPFVERNRVLHAILTTYERTADPHKALAVLERTIRIASVLSIYETIKYRFASYLPKSLKLYLKSKLRQHNESS